MARPGRPERNRAARSFRQLRRFHHVINSDEVFGTHRCLPCGYIEFHEDYLTAGRREVKEETGLAVEITALLSVASNFLRPDIHTLAVAVLAKPVGGAACPGDDVDELGWFSLGDKLPSFAFSADRHMVERYFATRLSGAPVDLAYARQV
jgi:8-oxo-dGTP diphosphatase